MRDGGVSQEMGALKMSFLLCGFCGGLKSCSSVAAATSGGGCCRAAVAGWSSKAEPPESGGVRGRSLKSKGWSGQLS